VYYPVKYGPMYFEVTLYFAGDTVEATKGLRLGKIFYLSH
jgi:hypothetical protein